MRLHNFALLLSTLPSVHGWGELGHRTVGYLASKYINNDAAQMVYTLLENDRGWDLSDAAIWADAVRRREGYTHTGAWHFIDAMDNPPYKCAINYTRDCPGPSAQSGHNQGCIVSALVNMTSRLLNPLLIRSQQKEALMFTIHFLGDIHQPLHTENLDRGGNGIHVCFDSVCGQKENLHSVWDTSIPHKQRNLTVHEGHPAIKEAARDWADELFEKNEKDGEFMQRFEGIEGTYDDVGSIQEYALDWAGEANQWVCGHVLRPGVEWVKEHDLGGEYFEGAREIVDVLVAKAGWRLGHWLNTLAAVWVQLPDEGAEERMEM